MALTSSDIRFTTLYDDVPKIRITDNLQSAYNTVHGIVLADLAIFIKIKLGSEIIYDNLWDGISSLPTADIENNSWYKDITQAEGLKINVLGTAVHGNYEITYQVVDTDSVTVLATATTTHSYGYVRPTANLTIDYSCGSSKQTPYIRSKDNTIYMIEYNGQSVYGSPVYTSHKFNYPISSGQASINQSPATSEILHGNLFTLLNTSSITSNCTFTVQTADSTNNMTVTYKCYINAETSENVSCDECTCLYWHCFNNIYDKYYEMLGVNPTLALKYKSMLTDISINYAYYHQALNCGEDATKFCNKLKELATLENCTCLPTQTTSVRISPVGGNSELTYVTGGSVDGNGDLILTYNDATTSNAGHVTGADGAAGADGANGSNGSNGTNGTDGVNGSAIVGINYESIVLLLNDTETQLKEFVFTENKLLNEGDKLKAKSYFLPNGYYSYKALLYINTNQVVSTDYLTNDDTVEFEVVNVYKDVSVSKIAIFVNGKYITESIISNSLDTVLAVYAIQDTGSTQTLKLGATYVEQSKGDI